MKLRLLYIKQELFGLYLGQVCVILAKLLVRNLAELLVRNLAELVLLIKKLHIS